MLFQDFKFMLQNEDLTSLYRKLGYGKVTKLKKAIDVIVSSKSLDEFLYKGYYDGLYSSEELILALCKALNADLKDELILAKKISNEKRKIKNSYIYVDTNFKRRTEPIHVLAMASGVRYISLYSCKELYFKTLNEKLEVVSKIVKFHFKSSGGFIPVFGNITGYKLWLEGEEYAFNPNGELITDKIEESVATLKIKNKDLSDVLTRVVLKNESI